MHLASTQLCGAIEGLKPVDLLLLMAASENDAPKVAELLRAGADASIRVRASWLICQLSFARGWQEVLSRDRNTQLITLALQTHKVLELLSGLHVV